MSARVKAVAKMLCPPLLWQSAQMLRSRLARPGPAGDHAAGPDNTVFGNPDVVRILETWGEGNAWQELQFLMAGRKGRVLDVACGLGRAMNILRQFSDLDVYGCDLSETLIDKAIASGIPQDHVAVLDATDMSRYPDGSFDWGYTLGALHYFTDEGIDKCLKECARVVSGMTFHLIPADRQNSDRGWIKTFHSVQSNSLAWWEKKFRAVYPRIEILDSSWADDLAVGKWIVCGKAG